MPASDHSFGQSHRTDSLPYDRGFHLSVLQGYLTPGEAARRGNRRSLARRIARRRRLPLVLAFMVADNRISLAQALERARIHAVPGAAGPASADNEDPRVVYAWLALGMILGVMIAMIWVRAAESPVATVYPTQEPVSSSTTVPDATLPRATRAAVQTTDENGRITSVVAADPRGVLLAYCDGAPPGDPRWPVGIGPTLPPSVGARLGILWRPNDWDASRRAIRIRKNPQTGKWFAGDGKNPISLEPAPEYPQEVGILPVRTGGGAPPG